MFITFDKGHKFLLIPTYSHHLLASLLVTYGISIIVSGIDGPFVVAKGLGQGHISNGRIRKASFFTDHLLEFGLSNVSLGG